MTASAPAGLARLNALPVEAARAELLRCCGSVRWAAAVEAGRPFRSLGALRESAHAAWLALDRRDRLQAFAAHPEIGGKGGAPAATRAWSRREQSSMTGAGADLRAALAEGQRVYRERFGYLFLVCATGRTPSQMLAALRQRLENDPERELEIASEEQWKITWIRLQRLIEEQEAFAMNGISTHVLDLSTGRPAAGIEVKLCERNRHGEWRDRGRGSTDDDGRAEALLGTNELQASTYRLRFEVADYFERREQSTLFPFVDVVFHVSDPAGHHHVPLLLSPHGYSTYRGS